MVRSCAEIDSQNLVKDGVEMLVWLSWADWRVFSRSCVELGGAILWGGLLIREYFGREVVPYSVRL